MIVLSNHYYLKSTYEFLKTIKVLFKLNQNIDLSMVLFQYPCEEQQFFTLLQIFTMIELNKIL